MSQFSEWVWKNAVRVPENMSKDCKSEDRCWGTRMAFFPLSTASIHSSTSREWWLYPRLLPRDDRGYNHPPAALLVLNWWTMSLSGVKLGNMSWITLRGSTSGPPLGAFGTLGVSPRLIPSGMIKSIIPSFSSRQCYITVASHLPVLGVGHTLGHSSQ